MSAGSKRGGKSRRPAGAQRSGEAGGPDRDDCGCTAANLLLSIRDLSLARTDGPGYRLAIPCLDVARGEKVAITGTSGCGKSTALDLLGLVLRPDRAERFFFTPAGAGGRDVAACWRENRRDLLAGLRQRHMGYVLQTGGLLPFCTVYENMELSARALGLPGRRESIAAIARALGIERLLPAMPETLSIGERQRAAIGRALAAGPDVVLADEPTAALDPWHAGAVLELLLGAVAERGVTLILVTHSPEIVRAGGFREYRMQVDHQDDGGVLAVLSQ